MALIAKKPLRAGHVLYANEGNVVSPAVVDAFGWHEHVYEGEAGDGDALPDAPAKPTKRRAKRQ